MVDPLWDKNLKVIGKGTVSVLFQVAEARPHVGPTRGLYKRQGLEARATPKRSVLGYT